MGDGKSACYWHRGGDNTDVNVTQSDNKDTHSVSRILTLSKNVEMYRAAWLSPLSPSFPPSLSLITW